MQTALEETDKHTVRLSVEVAPEEFRPDLERAYRKVAGEVRIPGFRKGKVPKQIIDARIGRDHVLEEFIRSSLPDYYVRAIREHDLAPISDPEIDLDRFEDGQPLKFTATVEVRPRLTLEREEYSGVHVEAPPTKASDEEVEEYVDRLRDRFAELEVVERPARRGDYVLADVRAYVHDREIPDATREGLHTEVGSEDLVPELDAELEGKRKGDILKFNAKLPGSFGESAGEEVTFQVLVKEVKAKKLLAADDEFAKTASEFDTIGELRDDIRKNLERLKGVESRAIVRDLVLRELVDRVDVELPERLVDEEAERRVESVRDRAERAGTTIDDVLASQGWDEVRLRADAREHAERALKIDLVLEAVARAEDLKVEREDLEREIAQLAEESGRDVRDVRKILDRSGQVASLAGDIIRSKALDFLVEHADIAGQEDSAPPFPEASEDEGNQDD